MTQEKHKGERIAKRMARAGLCSRREAEQWIAAGRVRVNSKSINSAALNVTDTDKIEVDGKVLAGAEQARLFLYHKPAGLVTSHKDERDRETVFSSLPVDLPRVISVGRLDLNTEGLLLLTNDGELARYIELPATGWKRKYRVRVHGRVDQKKLDRLKNGVTIEGVRYQPIIATLDNLPEDRMESGTNSWVSVILQEGKNREIRKVMEFLALKVTRLIRTDYGPFALGKLPRGNVIEIRSSDLQKHCIDFFDKKSIILVDKPIDTSKVKTEKSKKPKNLQEDYFVKPDRRTKTKPRGSGPAKSSSPSSKKRTRI